MTSRRLVEEESWWIASELVRRHPALRIHETHPGGGTYDVLKVFRPSHDESGPAVMINRAGSIQVHGAPREWVTSWDRLLDAEGPHDAIREIEAVCGWHKIGQAPATTRESLSYRLIARILLLHLHDRLTWTVKMGYLDSSGDDEDAGHHFDAALFPSTRAELSLLSHTGRDRLEWSRWWILHRDGAPVLALHDDAVTHSRGGKRLDLMSWYAKEHDLDRVTARVLAAIE